MALITDFSTAGPGVLQSHDVTPRNTETTLEMNISYTRDWKGIEENCASRKALVSGNLPFIQPANTTGRYEFSLSDGMSFAKDISFQVKLDNAIVEGYIVSRTINITCSVKSVYTAFGYISSLSPAPGAHTFPLTVRITRGGNATSITYAQRLIDSEDAINPASIYGPTTTSAAYVDVVLAQPSILMAVAGNSTGYQNGMIGIYTS